MLTKPTRREFIQVTSLVAGSTLVSPPALFGSSSQPQSAADYTLHIQASAIEIAPKRIVSAVTYSGQFPGPEHSFTMKEEVLKRLY